MSWESEHLQTIGAELNHIGGIAGRRKEKPRPDVPDGA
jgi:hypothetical protein